MAAVGEIARGTGFLRSHIFPFKLGGQSGVGPGRKRRSFVPADMDNRSIRYQRMVSVQPILKPLTVL